MNLFILAIFLVCLYPINITFTDVIERYLGIYDYLSPFLILMGEGISIFILSIIYSINQHPFKELIILYDEGNIGAFVLFIFLIMLYLIMSAIMNIYKVYCNIVYTPMARSFSDYVFNPLFNIYYFLAADDFHKNYIFL